MLPFTEKERHVSVFRASPAFVPRVTFCNEVCASRTGEAPAEVDQ